MSSAVDMRQQRQRAMQGHGAINAPMPFNAPPAVQEQPEFRNPHSVSNESGAASMPQVMNPFTVDTDGVLALPANPARGYLMVQNNSSADLLVSYDSLARPGSSYVIGPGGYFEPRVVPTNSIYVSSATLNRANCIVIEGNK